LEWFAMTFHTQLAEAAAEHIEAGEVLGVM
jgi:hypothetical protein